MCVEMVYYKLHFPFSGESSIGVIVSDERNVGKSLTLNILAKGQGLSSRLHPLLCAGGNQSVNGTSL